MKRILPLLLAAFFLPVVAHADSVTDWNNTARKLIQHDGLNAQNMANPGWSTRSLAMMNAAIYDAFQSTDRQYSPYLYDALAPANTSRDAAVHHAAYLLLKNFYPAETSLLGDDYNARMAGIADSAAKTQGVALGEAIAQAYLANRANDHSGDMVQYTPLPGPGNWRPDPWTPGQQAWGPGWRAVQPFAVGDAQAYVNALSGPPELNSPAYTQAFEQVRDYGDVNSVVRTDEQEKIALFWAYDRGGMGPPPVLYNRNLGEIVEQTGNTPEQNARLFAMASIAQADAAIAAWDAKFKYNFWRPVTAIQEAGLGGIGDADGNPDTVEIPNWKPMGAPGNDANSLDDDFTPPFPAWVSGHATMGAAVFKTLELFYNTNVFDAIDGVMGNDDAYTLTSQEAGSGEARDYLTLTQTAPLDIGTEDSPEGENGTSRVYLGIHWMFDQRDGIQLGHSIAETVFADLFKPVPEPACISGCLLLLTAAARRKYRSR